MPQATVHLLRHGEVHNPAGVLYGRLPEFHLSELGLQMAQLLADHFRDRASQGAKIVYLVASPLKPPSAALTISDGTASRRRKSPARGGGLSRDHGRGYCCEDRQDGPYLIWREATLRVYIPGLMRQGR